MKKEPMLLVTMTLLGACSSSSLEGTDARGSNPSPQTSSSTTPSATPSSTTLPSATGTVPSPSPEKNFSDFSMVFKGFSVKEGLILGNSQNFRFALNLQEKEQVFTKPEVWDDFEGIINPKTISRYELGSSCGNSSMVGSMELPAGDLAWVKSMDLTMATALAVPSDGSSPVNLKLNPMCYAYRMNGVWHWVRTKTFATWNPTTATFHMHFDIEKGPVDAIKILTDNGSQLALLRLVFSAKPM